MVGKSNLLMKRVEMRMSQELGKKLLSILKEEQVKRRTDEKSHDISWEVRQIIL